MQHRPHIYGGEGNDFMDKILRNTGKEPDLDHAEGPWQYVIMVLSH